MSRFMAADWRKKIADSMNGRIDRLIRIEAGDDDKAALEATKVLLELGGELNNHDKSDAPQAPLFALPADTKIDLKGTH